MVDIGKRLNRKMVAVISDMEQPLGYAVGNALEVQEAIDTLNGRGPEDLKELCLTLGSQMVYLAGKANDEAEARQRLEQVLDDGTALHKFADFIEAQGGDREQVYHPERLPKATLTCEVKAENDGYVEKIRCEEVGNTSLLLGGGRRSKTDVIDLSVGIILKKKTGDQVSAGESIATLYANDEQKMKEAAERLYQSYTFSERKTEPGKLIKKIIR